MRATTMCEPCTTVSIDKRPGLIARCHNVADVRDAVSFGRESGLEISVRGGGHNVAGPSRDRGRADDRPLADARGGRRPGSAAGPLAGRCDVERVQPGDQRLRAGDHRRGDLHHWCRRSHAWWRDRMADGSGTAWPSTTSPQVEVVTADGQVRIVNADNEPDLFWALRGGGGNFGVAASFEFETHPSTSSSEGCSRTRWPPRPRCSTCTASSPRSCPTTSPSSAASCTPRTAAG